MSVLLHEGGLKCAAKDNICGIYIERSEIGAMGTPRTLGKLSLTQKKKYQNKQTDSILIFQAFLLAQCHFRAH